MSATKEQIKQMILVIKSFYDIIESTGDAGVPSGHLYAGVMSSMDYDTYTRIIETMKETNLITETNYLLKVKK